MVYRKSEKIKFQERVEAGSNRFDGLVHFADPAVRPLTLCTAYGASLTSVEIANLSLSDHAHWNAARGSQKRTSIGALPYEPVLSALFPPP